MTHLGSLFDGARLLLSLTWKSSIDLAENTDALSRSPTLPVNLEEDETVRHVTTDSGGEMVPLYAILFDYNIIHSKYATDQKLN